MVGYGIYLLVEWMKLSDDIDAVLPSSTAGVPILVLGRPMLGAVALSDDILDYLPKAWFIYAFIGIGVIVFAVSLFGCCGAWCRNGCCLSFYSFLVVLLIAAELGAAAFIFFDHSWKDVIPDDKTGNFDTIYNFLEKNWKIAKWVAVGVVVYEVLLFLLALIVRAGNRSADYDSDDEYINPRLTMRQSLIHRQNAPATGVPVPTLDQRPSRNDAWSHRMREKYGLDTSEFTYNPSDPNRYQQQQPHQAEERSGGNCSIM